MRARWNLSRGRDIWIGGSTVDKADVLVHPRCGWGSRHARVLRRWLGWAVDKWCHWHGWCRNWLSVCDTFGWLVHGSTWDKRFFVHNKETRRVFFQSPVLWLQNNGREVRPMWLYTISLLSQPRQIKKYLLEMFSFLNTFRIFSTGCILFLDEFFVVLIPLCCHGIV